MLRDSVFIKGLLVFIILNLLLFLFITQFYNLISFNSENYVFNAHHFMPDNRVIHKNFYLPNALSPFDAQWYLKTAGTGYPSHPKPQSMDDKSHMGALTFAFFPLYPSIIYIANLIFKNIELSGFFVSFFFLLINFTSLYFVITKIYSKIVAILTCYLIFFYPFSIIFRSSYSENLLLFLLIWFSYFLIKKHFFLSALFLALLLVTKGNTVLLYPVFIYFVAKQKTVHPLFKKILISLIPIIPFLIWMLYCHYQTGDALYFLHIQSQWFTSSIPPLLYNIIIVSYFFNLPLHFFHASQLDVLTVMIIPIILYLSRKRLPKELLWIGIVLFVTPLLVKDLMAFSRIEMINFPIFLAMGYGCPKHLSITLICIFYILLLITSLYFINWYWIG